MDKKLLKAVMVQNGFSQKMLAQRIGMSPNSLNRKINGKREFTLSEAIAISTVLKVQNPEAIFFEENGPNTQRTKFQTKE